MIGIVQHQMHLAFGIIFEYAYHVAAVGSIHADKVVVFFVVRRAQLYSPVLHQRNAGLLQPALRAVMDGIADLIGRRSGGIDVELL